jgi:hypothetical protein
MAVLTAILTHLDAGSVERQLAYLRSLSPGSRFVICHAGRRVDFDEVETRDALFIEDPSLRGPHFDKSLNEVLHVVYDRYVRQDSAIEHVYLVEYDHLILRPDFEQTLSALADETKAGLLAKNAGQRNDTNWSHYLRFRDDERLSRFIAGISTRDDDRVRWGSLGTGLLLRRDALTAFCSLSDPPPYYCELFVPSVMHHLGFEVVDVDAVSDLYMAMRWLPEFTVEEAVAEKRAGRSFVHPFKRLDALPVIRDAPVPDT